VLFYVVVDAEYDFISAEDGTRHTAKVYGEAMDSADKATNKAMSAAYKYACLQTFCIPTEGDNDADGTTHEVQPEAPPAFDNEAKRITFTDALKRSFQRCQSVAQLMETYEGSKEQLEKMKASRHGSDIAASNALREEYGECLKILKAAEAAGQAPSTARTVEDALKAAPLPASVAADEIRF